MSGGDLERENTDRLEELTASALDRLEEQMEMQPTDVGPTLTLPCGHAFHRLCVSGMVGNMRHLNCPNCRAGFEPGVCEACIPSIARQPPADDAYHAESQNAPEPILREAGCTIQTAITTVMVLGVFVVFVWVLPCCASGPFGFMMRVG